VLMVWNAYKELGPGQVRGPCDWAPDWGLQEDVGGGPAGGGGGRRGGGGGGGAGGPPPPPPPPVARMRSTTCPT
jgi:hypothetical protein